MDILAAIKREERKLEKELGKLQRQLSGVQAAAKAHVYDVGPMDTTPSRVMLPFGAG